MARCRRRRGPGGFFHTHGSHGRPSIRHLSRDTIFYDFLWSQFIPFVFIPTAPIYSLGNPPPEANPK
ncbi:MAG: hypothetical protein LWW99_08820, partial [Deltaproteobacteria bacterium]|nr:hypothetical protein [Deltaproteobacteria bacterium]